MLQHLGVAPPQRRAERPDVRRSRWCAGRRTAPARRTRAARAARALRPRRMATSATALIASSTRPATLWLKFDHEYAAAVRSPPTTASGSDGSSRIVATDGVRRLGHFGANTRTTSPSARLARRVDGRRLRREARREQEDHDQEQRLGFDEVGHARAERRRARRRRAGAPHEVDAPRTSAAPSSTTFVTTSEP